MTLVSLLHSDLPVYCDSEMRTGVRVTSITHGEKMSLGIPPPI